MPTKTEMDGAVVEADGAGDGRAPRAGFGARIKAYAVAALALKKARLELLKDSNDQWKAHNQTIEIIRNVNDTVKAHWEITSSHSQSIKCLHKAVIDTTHKVVTLEQKVHGLERAVRLRNWFLLFGFVILWLITCWWLFGTVLFWE